ncbi:MlaD family protein [Hellea sp.]|jgi:phospholipid/cholesterol/gamma-HCH transport system substrate-binding protein|nr:MlaD family protein [Hellea sp.]MDA8888486.1 MlaD family protein [Hellea sp.]MDA8997086.1 MlaD family protein [Hellea sp.]MDB4844794.1 MlaD family protein [Hellea sp.]
MERKAHYALIGTFVLVSLAALLAFTAWLSNAQFDKKFDNYEISFRGGVQGLSEGTEVRFNGLKVGDITELRIDPNDNNSVIVDIQVEANTPIDFESIGRMEPLGLTGLNYIQIIPGGPNSRLIKNSTDKDPFRLKGEASRIDLLLGSGGTVMESSQAALARINAVMTPEAIMDFHEILNNLKVITSNFVDLKVDPEIFNRTMQSIEQASSDVSLAADAVDVAAKDFDVLIETDVKTVLDRSKISMEKLDKTLSAIEVLSKDSNQLITDGRDAINRLSNSGLTDIEETIDSIRRVVLGLESILINFEQNPTAFIVGSSEEKVELPQ